MDSRHHTHHYHHHHNHQPSLYHHHHHHPHCTLLSFSSHTSACMNCIFVHSFSLSLYTAKYIVYVRCIPFIHSFIHSFIYKWLSPFDSYESEPTKCGACKCNVNLFRFFIVLFSKVVRQWGICKIFFYIIYSIYDIILSASSTFLHAPVTLPAGATYVPAGPFCSYLLPSCRTLLQDPPAVTCCLPAGTCCLPAGTCCLPAGTCCLPAGTMPTACGFRILLLQLGDTFY